LLARGRIGSDHVGSFAIVTAELFFPTVVIAIFS
jgi:hypothetical protein